MSPWSPLRRFELARVLERAAVGEVAVGADGAAVEASLGPPELPLSRLSRRSRLWVSVYGNVTFLISQQQVVQIQVDYEGGRSAMVDAGPMGEWRLAEWRAWAERLGYGIERRLETLHVRGAKVALNLDEDGQLRMVILT